VVPARRQPHARNSYSNSGGGDREMVHSLTPEHLALGNGLVFDGLGAGFCQLHDIDRHGRGDVVVRSQVARGLSEPVQLNQFAPREKLSEATTHCASLSLTGDRQAYRSISELIVAYLRKIAVAIYLPPVNWLFTDAIDIFDG
jgi:hypothetical protein